MEDQNSSTRSSSQNSENSNSSLITGVAVFAFIAILSVGVVMYQRRPTPTADMTPTPRMQTAASSSPTSSTSPSMTGTTETSATAADLKDGTYTAEGDYVSPGGPEHVGVTVTLQDGKITDATFEPKATLPGSVMFQGKFKEGFKPLVIGKNIAEVKLDKVSGSSLTPKGFNDALQKIIVQAQS